LFLFLFLTYFFTLSILPHQSSIFYTPFFYSYSTLFLFPTYFLFYLYYYFSSYFFCFLKTIFFAFYLSSEIVSLFISLYSPVILSISTFTSLFFKLVKLSQYPLKLFSPFSPWVFGAKILTYFIPITRGFFFKPKPFGKVFWRPPNPLGRSQGGPRGPKTSPKMVLDQFLERGV